METAVIERKEFGGTCVNTGCVPTKTLVASVNGQLFEADKIFINVGAQAFILPMPGIEKREVVGTHLLVATGRRPNTDDLDLDNAGIEVDGRGYIEVDDQLRTNVPGVWALGDCKGQGAFTHTS